MGNWRVQRDGYTAEFVEGTRDRPHKPFIRVTGPGLGDPWEWPSNGEDAIDQLNFAIDTAKRGQPATHVRCKLCGARHGPLKTVDELDVTRVHFRMMGDEVLALFPDMEETRYRGARTIASYMHVGQHGVASSELIHDHKPATPEQYAALKAELEGIGYRLEVLP